MPILHALIMLGSVALAAEPCYQFVGYGRLAQENQKFTLVTHQKSQEEKVWALQPKDFQQKLETQAAVNLFVRAEGVLQGRELLLEKVEKSPEALTLSRGPKAVQIGKKTSCPR